MTERWDRGPEQDRGGRLGGDIGLATADYRLRHWHAACDEIDRLREENERLRAVVDVALAFRDNEFPTVDDGFDALERALLYYESKSLTEDQRRCGCCSSYDAADEIDRLREQLSARDALLDRLRALVKSHDCCHGDCCPSALNASVAIAEAIAEARRAD